MVRRPFVGKWVVGFFGLCLVVALMACTHTVSKNLPVVERGAAERLAMNGVTADAWGNLLGDFFAFF